MGRFVITTDNGSDIGEVLAKEVSMDIINLTVNIDGKEYDGIDKKIKPSDLYELMKRGVNPTTSQISPAKAEEFFENYLKKDIDIIHVCISGQISGTYNSCKIAKENLKERYPNRKIEVIDSLCASMGQGLLVLKTIENLQNNLNMRFENVVEFINELKHKVYHVFTVDSLVYLQRGGRISKTEALIGSMIGIKPILSVDNKGKLIPISKVRGRKNSLIKLTEKMDEVIDKENSDIITISHGNCLEEAKFVEDIIKKKFAPKKIIVEELGPVIGAHAGPGTIAVFCIAKNRIDKDI